MNRNDSIELKKSVLAKCGLRIKTDSVNLVVSNIFDIAKSDLEDKLELDFTIKDLLNPNKSRLILRTILRYFKVHSYDGYYYQLTKESFFSELAVSNDYILENIDRFKEIFASYLDNDLSINDSRKIPDAFICYLGKYCLSHNLFRTIAGYSSQEGPFKKYLKGSSMRNDITTRNMVSLWKLIEEMELGISSDERLIAYEKMLETLRYGYSLESYNNRNRYLAEMHEDLIGLIDHVESNMFHRNAVEIERIKNQLALIPN